MNQTLENILREGLQMYRDHDRRVSELLEANNRYLERARRAEAVLRKFSVPDSYSDDAVVGVVSAGDVRSVRLPPPEDGLREVLERVQEDLVRARELLGSDATWSADSVLDKVTTTISTALGEGV